MEIIFLIKWLQLPSALHRQETLRKLTLAISISSFTEKVFHSSLDAAWVLQKAPVQILRVPHFPQTLICVRAVGGGCAG